MSETKTKTETWRHDADGFLYKSYKDAAGQPRRKYADADWATALEARAALVDDLATALEFTKTVLLYDRLNISAIQEAERTANNALARWRAQEQKA